MLPDLLEKLGGGGEEDTNDDSKHLYDVQEHDVKELCVDDDHHTANCQTQLNCSQIWHVCTIYQYGACVTASR